MRAGALLAILLLAVAASAIVWLDGLRETSQARPAIEPEVDDEPRIYFEDFRIRAHERAGEPTQVLEGSRMIQYRTDGRGEILAPRLLLETPGQLPWRITGARGTLDATGNRVELLDNVVAVREPETPEAVTLRTPALAVFIDEGRAETDREVDMEGPDWRGEAVGMTAWFEAGRIELHSQVRARHDAPARLPETGQ